MSETILLDPEALCGASRVEVQISSDGGGPIEVRQDGVDWGDAEIEAHMADLGGVGSVPVDFDIPNRIIAMKVKIQASGDVTFSQARSMLQAKVALIQREGGWISREMPGVGTVYADLVNAKLALPGDWMQAHREMQLEATLSFEAIPEFYELEWEEVEFDDVEAGENHWRGVASGIRGDFPKGNRCKVVVEGDEDHDQLGLKAAFRSRHYSPDPTAACIFQAQDLTPLDLAAVVTLTGASGGATNNAVCHNNLGTGWTPILALKLDTGDYLTHTGTYRLVARVYTTSATPPELRCVFDVGDLVNPSENAPVAIPGRSNFYLVDLGEIRLDLVSGGGDHRWLGQLQGRGAAGGENAYIDRSELWPVDEYEAEVSITPREARGLTPYLVRDEFNQPAGALTGKAAAVGGTYVALTGSDATDFEVTTDHRLRRTAVSDTGTLAGGALSGRAVGLAGAMGATQFGASIAVETGDVALSIGQMVRVVDANNFALVLLSTPIANNGYQWLATPYVVVGGVVIAIGSPAAIRSGGGTAHEISLVTEVIGTRLRLYVAQGGAPYEAALTTTYNALGTILATGGVYLYDCNLGAAVSTRYYDQLGVWEPDGDAAIFAGKRAELRTDGASRASADGIDSGALIPFGGHPRLPQGGPVETIVATSRGDRRQLPDSGLGNVSVQVYYRPTWLTVPAQHAG